MQQARPRPSGHYGTLGVAPGATQRQIELAFHGWTDRLRAGAVDIEHFRRAENAYHVLGDPARRRAHDRQLGLVIHPAWSPGPGTTARASVRSALLELDRGRADRCRRLLERAVAATPRDPAARGYLALALARTGGCLHEAERHGRYALSRRPGEPAFYFALAEVLTAAGLHGRAFALRVRGWRRLLTRILLRADGCDGGHQFP